jgi:hypothetical protein
MLASNRGYRTIRAHKVTQADAILASAAGTLDCQRPASQLGSLAPLDTVGGWVHPPKLGELPAKPSRDRPPEVCVRAP